MEGPVPAALLGSGPMQQKKRPHPIPGTKALRFCDTTQIGACAPTRFTYHHTCPVDNGWEPVGIYWVLGPFKPPSEVHSPPASDPAHTLRGSLCIRLWPLLLSVIGFKYCFVVMHYTYAASICQPQISRRSPQGAALSEPCGKRSAREAGSVPLLRAVCFSPRWARGPASSAGRRIWSPSR